MKKVVKRVSRRSFREYIGTVITVYCANYIYTGKLVEIDPLYLVLDNSGVVYETGPYSEPEWRDVQMIPKGRWNVMLNSIESFGILK